MPFIHTHLPQATPAATREAVVQAIHQALVEGIGMPEDELFNMVTGYAPGQFAFSRSFNGVARSDGVVVVEITLRRSGGSFATASRISVSSASRLARYAAALAR